MLVWSASRPDARVAFLPSKLLLFGTSNVDLCPIFVTVTCLGKFSAMRRWGEVGPGHE